MSRFKVYKFEDIVISKKGFLRGPFGGDLKKEIFVEKGPDTYKVYEQGVVLNSDKNIGRYYISKDDYDKKLNKFSVQDKDFLVSCSGANMGAIYQLKSPFERGIINQALLRIRLNDAIIDDNYFYYLFSKLICKRITSGSGDSTIPNFPGLSVIKDVEIELPDKNTQIKVGGILSSLDAKIELNNRINTELEAMAKTLYDYWFVQFDFPNAEGKPYKSSGGAMVWSEDLKREIPLGWSVGELKEVVSLLVRGISPKYIDNDGIIVLNQRCIRDKSINPIFSRRHDYLSKNADSKLIVKGDILVNSTGVGTLGRVAIMKQLPEELTTVDSHVTIVRIDEAKANPSFTGYSLTQKEGEIESLGEGSTGQTELSRENLGRLKLILPSSDLQENFALFVEPLFDKIANNQQENQQFANLRDWLLPMLMNGQVVVA